MGKKTPERLHFTINLTGLITIGNYFVRENWIENTKKCTIHTQRCSKPMTNSFFFLTFGN